jgi:hypothetical protein
MSFFGLVAVDVVGVEGSGLGFDEEVIGTSLRGLVRAEG